MKWFKRIGLILLASILVVAAAGYWQLQRSLPQLDGERIAAVQSEVLIERDALGSAIITAQSRADAYFAQGFVHAQERFFEMDLTRRAAAGELSELFGAVALPTDRARRVHRMRARLTQYLASMSEPQKQLLQHYCAGVNSGLQALPTKPWSYSLLGVVPKAWSEVDTLLVNAAMHFNLQDASNSAELNADTARSVLSPEAFSYLYNRLSQQWDAPMMPGRADEFPDPLMPTPAQLDLRELPESAFQALAGKGSEAVRGSNNWAVSGAVTESGSAMLANDMHLSLSVPSIWFRQQLRYRHDGRALVITGVSLPGAPGTVVGSNGSVAWGNTNAYGDWLDFVRLQPIKGDDGHYQDADGPQGIERVEEEILVKGGASETLVVRQTRYGPIIAKDHEGKELALAWVAHRPGGVDGMPVEFELSQSTQELLDRARQAGMPHNNVVAADIAGHIGWTIGGQIPIRQILDGGARIVSSSELRGDVWRGFMAANDMRAPTVMDPPEHRIYTANARVANAAGQAFIGNGGFALGARASRIRDLLTAHRSYFRESDMLRIQLDDQSPLMELWWQHLNQRLAAHPRYAGVRSVLGSWNRRASAESVAYRIVRGFRAEVIAELLNGLNAPIRAKYPNVVPSFPSHAEVIVWPILQRQALHLLPKPHQDFSQFELACLDRALAKILGKIDAEANAKNPFAAVQLAEAELRVDAFENHPWGEQNTAKIQHPLARAAPVLGWFLNMPADALPGDTGHVVRAQGPAFGASQRLVVAPGHEEQGLFHMPGGQSGHPLSPFYGAGHADWVDGHASPLLPTAPLHRLRLRAAVQTP